MKKFALKATVAATALLASGLSMAAVNLDTATGVANFAKENGAPLELVLKIRAEGRLPVVNFAAGGIATPADAALMMQLGLDGVFVGSGIFKSTDPAKRAKAIVAAVTHYNDYKILAEVSRDLGEAMPGLEISTIAPEQRMQERGW